MLTSFPDLKRLRRAFVVIEKDAVPRVFGKAAWRRWRYDELASLYGEECDWRPNGSVRSALIGGAGREWLRQHYRLWWTTDPRKAGILFTADPLTGMEWDRERIAARVSRDAEYLTAAARAASEMQPAFRSHFQRVEGQADRLKVASSGLLGIHAPFVQRSQPEMPR